MSIETFYFSIISAALLLSALGLWFTAIIPGIDRWSKRFFQSYFITFTLCGLFSIADLLLFGHPVPRTVIYLLLVLECLLLSLPLPMLTAYLLHSCGEDMRASKLLRAVLGLWAVFVILLASSAFTGIFTYTVSDNYYDRGPLYPLLLLPLVALSLLNLTGTIRRRSRLSRKVFLSFLVAALPLTVTLLAQMFVEVLPLVDISFVLSAISMYGFILSDQIEQDRRQQQEIANQRASIMVLQMRPHFIYNTMMSIYHLCAQDAKRAQQVTLDFTDYLRRNFTAIAKDGTIPFTDELEHARAYLAVEQVRFEDKLFVLFDTPCTMFRVPPLTLQPIVENAVKHGVSPDLEPLTITVLTRETDAGSEIVVEDNGPGFSPADDDEPHIALANIRERLQMMCGGTLTIEPREGGGTRVTVFVPAKKAE
ncbi:MAG: histidine kinase [Oscillospiraceae bacterium]|nr:histidine kinase [Oscillospiraceae bacterium]